MWFTKHTIPPLSIDMDFIVQQPSVVDHGGTRSPTEPNAPLTPPDWIIVALYLAAMVGMSLYLGPGMRGQPPLRGATP
jgi:hypothetical protein